MAGKETETGFVTSHSVWLWWTDIADLRHIITKAPLPCHTVWHHASEITGPERQRDYAQQQNNLYLMWMCNLPWSPLRTVTRWHQFSFDKSILKEHVDLKDWPFLYNNFPSNCRHPLTPTEHVLWEGRKGPVNILGWQTKILTAVSQWFHWLQIKRQRK